MIRVMRGDSSSQGGTLTGTRHSEAPSSPGSVSHSQPLLLREAGQVPWAQDSCGPSMGVSRLNVQEAEFYATSFAEVVSAAFQH